MLIDQKSHLAQENEQTKNLGCQDCDIYYEFEKHIQGCIWLDPSAPAKAGVGEEERAKGQHSFWLSQHVCYPAAQNRALCVALAQ